MESGLKRKLSHEIKSSKRFCDNAEDPRRHSTITVGSRKSQLAVIQTNSIMKALNEKFPDLSLQIETMETLGDKILDLPLPKIGEKSLFTKDLEVALQSKKVDFLVHSLKDLPTTMPEGMVLSTIYKRDNPHDCVIFHPKYRGMKLADLPPGSVVGTSSLRRVSQLKRKYNHLQFESIRGNLNTRLKKLQQNDTFAAIVLAQAGVDRMKWSDEVGQILTEDECLYAIGQGAMAVEIRSDDKLMTMLLSELSDIPTLIACAAERSFMRTLNGGCSTPIGCYSKFIGDKLSIRGVVLNEDGSVCLDHTVAAEINLDKKESGDKKSFVQSHSGLIIDSKYKRELETADELGSQLAFALKKLGADEVLAGVRARLPKVTNIQIPTAGSMKF